MLYYIFINPEKLSIIRNDQLSDKIISGERIKDGLPGMFIPVMDYNNEEFDSVWMIWNEIPDTNFPLVAFLDKIKAKNHLKTMQTHNNHAWSATSDTGHTVKGILKLEKFNVTTTK